MPLNVHSDYFVVSFGLRKLQSQSVGHSVPVILIQVLYYFYFILY